MTALALFVVVTVGGVQTPAVPFDGVWIAEHRGVTHVRLTLRTIDGVTTGTISLGNMEVGEDGVVVKAEKAPDAGRPIFDVRRRGNVLAFAVKDVENTDQFELAANGDRPELTLVLSDEDRREFADEGIPIPKPIRLMRGK